jgi:signal transduction histidine kinase
VQAQTTRLLARLRELEERHSEDKVFSDLLELDHGMSQIGRLADNIALLSGGRTGRRWTKPIVMESVIRGAIGRIQDYRRVRLHSVTTIAVAGHAAEAVMHTLAELIDNAATFSPPPSEVHVYVEEADAGVVVTIEDSGLGMRVHERQRAETAVSQPLDLATLTGTRLGHAVVGRLAARYGLTVSFRPSARGGTGVVVMIPRQLLTQPRQPGATPRPRPAREEPAETVGTAGLPKRPRGQTLARSSTPGASAAEQPTVSRDSGQRFAAFRQTVRRDQPKPGEEKGHVDE